MRMTRLLQLILLPLFLLLFALLLPIAAQAAPYVVGQIGDAATDACVWTLNGGAATTLPVEVDNVRGQAANGFRVCKLDVAAVPTGVNNVTVKARSSVWGVESSVVPFAFTRPGSTSAPATLQLAP